MYHINVAGAGSPEVALLLGAITPSSLSRTTWRGIVFSGVCCCTNEICTFCATIIIIVITVIIYVIGISILTLTRCTDKIHIRHFFGSSCSCWWRLLLYGSDFCRTGRLAGCYVFMASYVGWCKSGLKSSSLYVSSSPTDWWWWYTSYKRVEATGSMQTRCKSSSWIYWLILCININIIITIIMDTFVDIYFFLRAI